MLKYVFSAIAAAVSGLGEMQAGIQSCPKSTQVKFDANLIKWAQQSHIWKLRA